jgi:hypothetical protein
MTQLQSKSLFWVYRPLFVENKADCRVSGACSALDTRLLFPYSASFEAIN